MRPYISPISPLHLPYISPTSPLHLPYISRVASAVGRHRCRHAQRAQPLVGRRRERAAQCARAKELDHQPERGRARRHHGAARGGATRGDAAAAQRCFDAAYALDGKPSSSLSAANMVLTQGGPRNGAAAAARYQRLLERRDLSAPQREVATRKLAECEKLLQAEAP